MPPAVPPDPGSTPDPDLAPGHPLPAGADPGPAPGRSVPSASGPGPKPGDAVWAGLVDELCRLGSGLVSAGLVLGSGGNLSARVPGGDVIAVTARGTWLDRLVPADFSLVRLADGAVLGGAPAPSTELALHVECYRSRPDVTAVVHVHPQTSVLLTALGHPIRAITTDHQAYVGEVRVAPYRHPGTPELATEAAALLADGSCDCVVLSHHGCSVVADSVEMAHRRVLNLEEAAKLSYAALLLGDVDTICPPGYRERLRGLTAGDH